MPDKYNLFYTLLNWLNLFVLKVQMSAVQRARMLYYENSPYSFSNLKIFDTTEAVRTKSLESLQQITNLCQKIKLTPLVYQQQPVQLKLKFLQAYQYSYLYSANLKNMCDEKQIQINGLNSKLKQQIQTKRNAIKEHKKKVQKRKHEYRQIKINQAKHVCKHFQQQMQNLKNQQNQLAQIKTKLQQQILIGRNNILSNHYQIQPKYLNQPIPHQANSFSPDSTSNYQNSYPSNPTNPIHLIKNLNHNHQLQMNCLDIAQNTFNIHHQVASNHKIPIPNQTMINSNHKSNSNSKSLSQIFIDQENKRQQLEAQRSFKANSMKSSNNQRNSQEIIDQYNKEEQIESIKQSSTKGNTKEMVEQKVKIKVMQTQIGDKDDLMLKQSTKPMSNISKNSQKLPNEIDTRLKINEKDHIQMSSPSSKVRLTDQTLNDLDELNDIVNDLDDFDLGAESRISKPSPKNKPSINSKISKGSSSFIDSTDSFFNKKLTIDSNLTKNDLLNSTSGINAQQTQTPANLFNKTNIKRKSTDFEIPSHQKPPQDYPSANNDQIPDKNLWMSKNGIDGGNVNTDNLFNAPKKKNSENINLSYSSLNDLNLTSSPRKSENLQDDDDLDDLELGFTTNQSKVYKKNTQNQSQIPFKVTTSKLEDVAQEQESQITKKENTKMILPPEISKDEVQSDYEDDFENQNQDHNKSQINLQDKKPNQQDTINKSQIQINVSPNNSFTDLAKDQTIFPDLVSANFKLNQDYKVKQNSHQQKGLFFGYLNETESNKQDIGITQDNFTDGYDQVQEKVTISNDFMDDLFIPQQSNIGKKPTGLKKTSKLILQNDMKQSYKINVINSEHEITLKESIHRSKNDEEDLLLQLGEDLLSSQQIQKNKTKKPQTMNLIESTTFNEDHNSQKQSISNNKITDSNKLVSLTDISVLKSQQKTKQSQSQSLKLFQLNNPVLQSKDGETIAQEEVQEDINFQLEEDNSKLMQSQKQEIQKKLVAIMRNKFKSGHKQSLNAQIVDQQILYSINLLLPQNNPLKNQPDWKLVKKTFQTKIKQLTKQHIGYHKNIQDKLNAIQQKNRKIDQQKAQKQKSLNQANQDQDDSVSDLNYSQSLIKDSFKKASLNKKNLKLNELQTNSESQNTINKMTNSSVMGDDAMTLSLKQKSTVGIKNQYELPKIIQNNSFEVDSIYNQSNLNQTDEFMISQLNEESKFIKRKEQTSKHQELNKNRSNNLIGVKVDIDPYGDKDEKRPHETSKSKYIKTITPTAKSVPKESAVTRLQQNKYVTIEDPLNNQIATNKSLPKITIEDDEEDF